MCLPGQVFGPVPVTEAHRHQRSFTRRHREDIRRAGVPDADRIAEEHVTGLGVSAQDVGEPLKERGYWCHDARCRQPARGLVGVGAHLLDPVSAQQGPHHGGPGLGGRVVRPDRFPVLPAVDRIGPLLGVDRPSRPRGEDGGPHGGYRMTADRVSVI